MVITLSIFRSYLGDKWALQITPSFKIDRNSEARLINVVKIFIQIWYDYCVEQLLMDKILMDSGNQIKCVVYSINFEIQLWIS